MNTNKIPLPSFYNPAQIGKTFMVDYADVALKAIAHKELHNISDATHDQKKVALVVIDGQITFCHPDAQLPVGGALGDMQRVIEWGYQHIGLITKVAFTLDTHLRTQIFHPSFWVDPKGKNVPMNTLITVNDVKSGKWKVSPTAVANLAKGNYAALNLYAIHYVEQLEKQGRGPLIIWPYHALLGGIEHALVPSLHEFGFAHGVMRNTEPTIEVKGTNPYTENYSVFSPEVKTRPNPKDPHNEALFEAFVQDNIKFIELLLNYDKVVFCGEAGSHCLAWSIYDLLTKILQKDPSLAQKVYVLRDGTSPVIIPGMDFTAQMNEAFDKFTAAGMHVVSTTTPIEQWPNFVV